MVNQISIIRNDTVTYTKAVGIILMVLGHALYSTPVERFISLFHMPLFFIMSGYCFKEKYFNDTKLFIVTKVRGIWMPFVKYGILFLCLHNILIYSGIYVENTQGWYSWELLLHKSVNVALRLMLEEPLVATFWFLRTLFWSNILFFVLYKHTNKIVTAIILIIGCVVLCYMNYQTPVFHITSKEFMASIFIFIGFLTRKMNVELKGFKKLFTIIFAVICMIYAYWYNPTSMTIYNNTKQIIPYIITGCMGTYIVYVSTSLCIKKECLVLKIMGSNTLYIMIWHLACFLPVTFVLSFFTGANYRYSIPLFVFRDYSVAGCWIVYLFSGVVLPVFLKYLYDKYR